VRSGSVGTTSSAYRHSTGGYSAEEAEADRPVAALTRLRPLMRVSEVYAALGKPHDDLCSGIPCPTWYFDDGSSVTIMDIGGNQRVRVLEGRCEEVPCRRRQDAPAEGAASPDAPTT
jgi:hypothetical protein